MRVSFTSELEQLRLQVEVMAMRVDQNLERMRSLLVSGDTSLARPAFEADDEIDAMNVSLTERCYDLLRREAPVASDLRFVVSVLRILGELERIGDLALRVIKLGPEHHYIVSNRPSYDILVTMANQVIEDFRDAVRAWATQNVDMAASLALRERPMDVYYEHLMSEILQLQSPDAVRVAVSTFAAGRALERISDHAVIIGARLRYLITGDPDHLTSEVR